MHRKTDHLDEPVHFQMGRFALQNGQWFYMTREFPQRGPFDSKDDAAADLKAYLSYRYNIEKFGK